MLQHLPTHLLTYVYATIKDNNLQRSILEFATIYNGNRLILLLQGEARRENSGFSKTTGFRHSSIEDGAAAIMKLGAENGFKVDTTENAEKFTENNLKQYSAVVFLNTTQDVLNYAQQSDFERYIQAGGGFIGIHAAADTEYNWPWYNKLLGAYFESHPEQQDAVIHVVNQSIFLQKICLKTGSVSMNGIILNLSIPM